MQWTPGAAGPLLADEERATRSRFRDDEEPEWQDLALCAETDPEAFFPEKGGSVREAKKVCRKCEVRAQCLEYALENDERFGIWGGLSERERRHVKRETAAPAAPRLCRKYLHVMTEANTRPCGGCIACKQAADDRASARRRIVRAGSLAPQPGRRLAA
jgi:WhiB family redox-sensing transcriptional regulator